MNFKSFHKWYTHTHIGTHKYMHMQTHTDSDANTISPFALLAQLVYMPKIQILYLAHHRQKQLHTVMYRHTQTHKCTGTHRYRYTQMHAHTHNQMHTGTQ